MNKLSLALLLAMHPWSGWAAQVVGDADVNNGKSELVHTYQREVIAPENYISGASMYQLIISNDSYSSIKPYFSKIRLPKGAYIELKGKGEGSEFIYGERDFKKLENASLFAAGVVDGDRLTISVVYPKGVAMTPHDSVILEQWGSTPLKIEKRLDARVPNHWLRTTCLKDRLDEQSRQQYKSNLALGLVRGIGTGWLHGTGNLMITNAHVVKPGVVNDVELVFNFMYDDCDDSSVAASNQMRVKAGDVLSYNHISGKGIDFAMFNIDQFDYEHGKLKYLFGGLAISEKVPKKHDLVYINGFPNAAPAVNMPQIDGNYCSVTQISVTDSDTLRTNCKTAGGSSGSPVISQSNHHVIGLHYASSSKDEISTPATRFWPFIKDKVYDGNMPVSSYNQAVAGAAETLISKQVVIDPFNYVGGGFEVPLAGSVRVLSGEYQPKRRGDTFDRIKVKAESQIDGHVKDLFYRVHTESLEDPVKGCRKSSVFFCQNLKRKLFVSFEPSDNQGIDMTHPYKSWIGFEFSSKSGINQPTNADVSTLSSEHKPKITQLMIRVMNKSGTYDPFVSPFEPGMVSEEDKLHFNFSFDTSNKLVKDYKQRHGSNGVGFLAIRQEMGPTKLIWQYVAPEGTPYNKIRAAVKNEYGDVKVITLRGVAW
ncbi:trypsin-like serine peptidase [Aeromonas veronii]|uniref:trypsin-like serine peptidase n=1 Tax=Aeromonas veronii TaxID=654 RepID=UPI0024439004|nr:serine protease [Aeromonas veronii]